MKLMNTFYSMIKNSNIFVISTPVVPQFMRYKPRHLILCVCVKITYPL